MIVYFGVKFFTILLYNQKDIFFKDKLNKIICDTSSNILFYNDNIIWDSSNYDIQYMKFIKIIEWYINVNWILILEIQNQLMVMFLHWMKYYENILNTLLFHDL